MSVEYEDALIAQFGELDVNNFRIILSEPKLFLCGGEINASSKIPPSFRDRLLSHTAAHDADFHELFVLAETFKDYFKENLYTDLLLFEDDIANISTLVIIFLESPGSLVELGLFCNKPHIYKKLLIIAPNDELKSKDSFIYLGPLEFIRKKDNSSVLVYPWPDKDIQDYEDGILYDLCTHIRQKLDNQKRKSQKFTNKNSGHIALLICEVITLSYPILLGEIELAMEAMDIDLKPSEISRYLYLLMKLELVEQLEYSNHNYYLPTDKDQRTIIYGKTKTNKVLEASKIRMSIMQSYVLSKDIQSSKRQYALKQIIKKLKGDTK